MSTQPINSMADLNFDDLKPRLTEEDVSFFEASGKADDVEVFRTVEGTVRGILRGFQASRETLSPNAWNHNEMDEATRRAVAESINQYGMLIEIVCYVNEHYSPDAQTFTIIDGEHRYNYLASGEVVPINLLFGYTEAELRKATIILDETVGTANPEKLAEALQAIQLQTGGTNKEVESALPFTVATANALAAAAKVAKNPRPDFNPQKKAAKAENDKWKTITCVIPAASFPVIDAARGKVELMTQKKLPLDPKVAWGMVLELMSADFLGGAMTSHEAEASDSASD